MKLVTSGEMKRIDAKNIQDFNIPSLDLMEKAGLGTAQLCKEVLGGEVKGKKIVIICGKGNNGGDGFVAGRYLAKWRAKVSIYLLGKKDEPKGDALTNLNRAFRSKLPVKQVTKVEELPQNLAGYDLIVDAIFGTGFKGGASGLEKETIQKINQSGLPVVAVDLPSGLNADTGNCDSACVQATATAAMGLPKLGVFISPGRELSGRVSVIDIGLAAQAVESEKLALNLITQPEVRKMLPPRPGNVHKGDCGKVFVLAGSTGYTGAACLCSLAVLRAGAGVAILGVPKSLNPIFEVKLTEVITKPLPDVGKKGYLALSGLGEIASLADWADVLAIGPGLGENHQTKELIKRLLSGKINKPLVLDADGLNAFGKNPELLKNLPFPLVITPHPGELASLLDKPVAEIEKNRIEVARQTAAEFALIVVLKGAPTVVAEPGGEVFVNSTGNSGMATAGSGDVLTGLIAGLLAQNLKLEKNKKASVSTLESALAGVYLHGLAGDLAKKSLTAYAMIAGDILERIPEAFAQISTSV